MKLPDFEAWAVFAKVAESGSFSEAAGELGLSKATVSKLVTRLEERLGSALFHRTSRRLALSESGRLALDRARTLVADAEALEAEASDCAEQPMGLVRMAAPMSFGVRHLAPLLPDFFAQYPDVAVELALSDELVDLVASGFDLALRIASLADSSLLARKLCEVRMLLVGAPGYFARHGRPAHPADLTRMAGLLYTNLRQPGVWRFTHRERGDYVATLPPGPLRANSADAMLPSLRAGMALALLPEFLVWDDVQTGRLEAVMCDWAAPAAAVSLITPPGGPRPRRVSVLMDFLASRLRAAPWALERHPGAAGQAASV